ncbi:MAG TPA: tRNA guanosine(34) transglycosylase Tgt, partial [Fibrobacteria bacterium]|nr:tRNA guanosine(34) transglycosylase Tgt [Fibrobacteria bacterium]
GEPAELMYEVAGYCAEYLPPTKPRYVMGVGTPSNLLNLVGLGMDMFDCVLPTRNARNGTVYTWDGALHYKAARHARELDIPFDSRCSCYACGNFSRAYLRHLFVAGEMLALEMATLHSIHFYQELMAESRRRILDGSFATWSRDLLDRWGRQGRDAAPAERA